MNKRAYGLSHKQTGKVAVLFDIKYYNRNGTLLAQCECGCVHHLEVVGKRLGEGKFLVADRTWILVRVSRIDPVNPGSLEQSLGTYLKRPESSSGVGGEERIAGSSGDECDTLIAASRV